MSGHRENDYQYAQCLQVSTEALPKQKNFSDCPFGLEVLTRG